MGHRKLESREYKVMLATRHFADPGSLSDVAWQLWTDLVAALGGDSTPLSSTASEWSQPTRRMVTFFDTATGGLNRSDFVLRYRSDDDGSNKVTLKRRSPDRVLAANNGIEKHDKDHPTFEVKRKFEEDIKLTVDDRMRSMFSHSLDWKNPEDDVDLTAVGLVERAFPGFESATSLGGSPLDRIGPSPVTEYVIELDDCDLAGKSAKVVFVAWYARSIERPAVVEFSYKYEGDEEDFDPSVAAAGLAVLRALGGMSTWRPPMEERITKTRWIYEQAGLLP